jgi:hypothetical protein
LVAEALYLFEPGFSVVSAPDPQQAREWLRRISPDLVVLGAEVVACAGAEKILLETGAGCRLLIYGSPGATPDRFQRRTIWIDPKPDLPALLDAVHRLFNALQESEEVLPRTSGQSTSNASSRRLGGTKDN